MPKAPRPTSNIFGPDLADVSAEDLRAAVAKMAKELGVFGSHGDYSLYEACLQEREKAIAQRQKWDDIDKATQQ